LTAVIHRISYMDTI